MKSANALLHRRKIRPTVTAVTKAPIAEPGNPTLVAAGFRRRQQHDPGLCHVHERQCRLVDQVQASRQLFQTSDSERTMTAVGDSLMAEGKTMLTAGTHGVVTLTGGATKG